MEGNNKKLIGIQIPDETQKLLLKNNGVKNAIGALADVVTGIQDKVDNGIKYNKSSDEKNNIL